MRQNRIVFYVDETGEHGLVAAMEDLTVGATSPNNWGTNGYEWGCLNEIVDGADLCKECTTLGWSLNTQHTENNEVNNKAEQHHTVEHTPVTPRADRVTVYPG